MICIFCVLLLVLLQPDPDPDSVARRLSQLNGDRFLCWKHSQAPPGLFDMLTSKR